MSGVILKKKEQAQRLAVISVYLNDLRVFRKEFERNPNDGSFAQAQAALDEASKFQSEFRAEDQVFFDYQKNVLTRLHPSYQKLDTVSEDSVGEEAEAEREEASSPISALSTDADFSSGSTSPASQSRPSELIAARALYPKLESELRELMDQLCVEFVIFSTSDLDDSEEDRQKYFINMQEKMKNLMARLVKEKYQKGDLRFSREFRRDLTQLYREVKTSIDLRCSAELVQLQEQKEKFQELLSKLKDAWVNAEIYCVKEDREDEVFLDKTNAEYFKNLKRACQAIRRELKAIQYRNDDPRFDVSFNKSLKDVLISVKKTIIAIQQFESQKAEFSRRESGITERDLNPLLSMSAPHVEPVDKSAQTLRSSLQKKLDTLTEQSSSDFRRLNGLRPLSSNDLPIYESAMTEARTFVEAHQREDNCFIEASIKAIDMNIAPLKACAAAEAEAARAAAEAEEARRLAAVEAARPVVVGLNGVSQEHGMSAYGNGSWWEGNSDEGLAASAAPAAPAVEPTWQQKFAQASGVTAKRQVKLNLLIAIAKGAQAGGFDISNTDNLQMAQKILGTHLDTGLKGAIKFNCFRDTDSLSYLKAFQRAQRTGHKKSKRDYLERASYCFNNVAISHGSNDRKTEFDQALKLVRQA